MNINQVEVVNQINDQVDVPSVLNTITEKFDNISEYASEIFSKINVSDSLQKGLMYVGIGSAVRIMTYNLFNFVVLNDLNFNPQLPEIIHNYASSVGGVINKFYVSNCYNNQTIFSPIAEELVFRVILQEGLLKKVPNKILNKIAPEYSPLVDGNSAKVARIALSALATSLAYARNASMYMHVTSFALGILYGAIQEISGNPLLAIACHMGHNR